MAGFIWNDIVVSIDDRRLHGFRSLNLHQPVGDHHSFELTLDPDTVGKRYVEGFTDGTEWLGKRMLVHANGDDTAVFLGVVSKVCIRKESLDGGTLLVCGHSTTYLLENGPSFRSWLGRTLEEIVGELCAKAGVGLMANPENRLRLDYVCQYDESDFTFIRRLAHNYHEWLYYDGTRLVFGKPKRPDAVGLELDRGDDARRRRWRRGIEGPRAPVYARGGRPCAGGFPTWRPEPTVRHGQPVQRQHGHWRWRWQPRQEHQHAQRHPHRLQRREPVAVDYRSQRQHGADGRERAREDRRPPTGWC